MDLPGMGGSAPSRVPSIEQYAASALAVLDALGVEHCDVVGHHTGGVVALELAASQPERVRRLVLSSTPWVDRSARLRRRDRPAVDEVEPSGDGSHLVKLWQQRQVFYPPDRPDLLERFVTDALRATDVAAGHRAVGRYEMEQRVELVVAPTLCIGHEDDMFAFPDHHELLSRIAGATSETIAGGMVPLEWRAAEVAEAVMAFLGAGD
jgi:pimeloyl-ACP methyl ester carboxylesterase